MKNPRPDAKLKRLPEATQEALFNMLSTPGVTQADAIAWLKADGVSSSSAALSDWWEWYQHVLRNRRSEAATLQMLEDVKQRDASITQSELDRLATLHYSMQAINNGDVKAWSMIQRIELDKRKLELDTEALKNQVRDLELKELKHKESVAKLKELLAQARAEKSTTGHFSTEAIENMERELKLL